MFIFTLSIIKQSRQITVKPTIKPLIEEKAVILPVSENDPMFGNPGSPITIAEFFSFDCQKCLQHHKEIINYIENNPGKVRLIIKEIAKENWLGAKDVLPLLALTCAREQNKYWEFLNKSIELRKLDETSFISLSKELDLNSGLFTECLHKENYRKILEAEQDNLKILGFTNPPYIFINNKQIHLDNDIKIIDIIKSIVSP